MRILFKVIFWLALCPLLIIPKLWRVRYIGKPIAIVWSLIVGFFGLVVVIVSQIPPTQQLARLATSATPIVNALVAPQVQETSTATATATQPIGEEAATEENTATATPNNVNAATATIAPIDAQTTLPTATSTHTPSTTPTATATRLATFTLTSVPSNTPPPAAPVANAQTAQVTRIVDGDTIHVLLDGSEQIVRYIGIDTPERGQPGYQAATEANRTLVEGQVVYLVKEISDTDRNDRLLRQIYLSDGRWVNGELVVQGWAQPVKYPPDIVKAAQLEKLAVEAAQMARGFWSGSSAYDGAMSYALTKQDGNIRQGPGTNFAISGNVVTNTPLTIFGRNEASDWVQVRLPNRAGGWMSESLLTVNVAIASIPVPINIPGNATLAPVLARPTPVPVVVQTGPIVKQGANLRSGPGTNYPVIGNATKSQKLEIVGKNSNGTWYKLANQAWISASLVANPPDNLSVASAPPPPVQAVAPVQPLTPAQPAGSTQPAAPPAQADCDPNYAGACIPNVSYDLDCPQVAAQDFQVVGYDHHRFDRDKDGLACES